MNAYFATVADLLEYPNSEWETNIARSVGALSEGNDDITSLFRSFAKHMNRLSDWEREELYVRSFELNPACTLEVGYHIFGETYKRGTFLAHLRREEEGNELGQERQLPDFLPVLLRLLALMDDPELRGTLIETCLIPAIETIVGAFKEKENPYGDLLRSLLAALRYDLHLETERSTAHHPELNGHV